MASKIKNKLANILYHRIAILIIISACLFGILVARLFQLQIIDGAEYAENFTLTTTRTRTLNSTRGNIYDCNGNLIAYNELSNNITLEDNGSYETTREKNLALNGIAYKLIKIIESCGDSIDDNFHIDLDENDNYVFDVSAGTTRDRFRADVYGYQTIDEMSEEEASSTPDEIIEYLAGGSRFAILEDSSGTEYTEEELIENGLPTELTKDEVLKIVMIRYQLNLISFQRYVTITVASDVSDETVAAIEENLSELQGVAIEEDSIRVYNYAESMSSIIGYTGVISADELEELSEERSDYTSTSIVGKTGIEQYMETYLQGTDGSETVAINNTGTVLEVFEELTVEPQQGDDVYLTIDAELQEACYNILEQRIAGILVSNIVFVKTLDDLSEEQQSSDVIYIPIYDVYNALINNNVIDISEFSDSGATVLEQDIYERFNDYFANISAIIKAELLGENDTVFSELSDEMQEYLSYIVEDLLISELELIAPSVDYSNDDVYIQWTDGEISAYDFLMYAITSSWVDLSQLYEDSTYSEPEEVIILIADYIIEYIAEDTDFAKLLYYYMLLEDIITPREICQLLYDQAVLSKDDEHYLSFSAGEMTPDELIVTKISNLEITPAQLALDPCSGSIVVTDPETGDIKALVSYPGYDNNRLANTMDTEYYYSLYYDQSTPFYNKATQQRTAPGSTFKLVTAAAVLSEGVIDTDSLIDCTGLFGEGLVESGDQLHCWLLTGHGALDIIGAIGNSCNVFFATGGYRLGLDSDGSYSSSLATAKLQAYAAEFNLDTKTNIQISESSPQVSTDMPIPSSIGQGTHAYTTTQLARYAATIYSKGVSTDLNLLDCVTTSSGEVLKEYEAEISNVSTIEDYIWDIIHEGMREVILSNSIFDDLEIELYGKTGTAEEDETRPPHGLFIGFTENTDDDIAIAVRIAYGYSWSNAAVVAKDVLEYYYELTDEDEIITGSSATDNLSNQITD